MGNHLDVNYYNYKFIDACIKNQEKDAINYLHHNDFKPDYVDVETKLTPLIITCTYDMEDLALEIIKTDNFRPHQIDTFGLTALDYASLHKMLDVVDKLLQIENIKVTNINSDGNTPLMNLCMHNTLENLTHECVLSVRLSEPYLLKITEIILKLIEKMEYNFEQINNQGYTALILACKANMDKVALKLIQTKKSRPEHIDNFGNTALDYAKLNSMELVILELEKNQT